MRALLLSAALLLPPSVAIAASATANREPWTTERCQANDVRAAYASLLKMGVIYEGKLLTNSGTNSVWLTVGERHWKEIPFRTKEAVASIAACYFAESNVPLEHVVIISELTEKRIASWYQGRLNLR